MAVEPQTDDQRNPKGCYKSYSTFMSGAEYLRHVSSCRTCFAQSLILSRSILERICFGSRQYSLWSSPHSTSSSSSISYAAAAKTCLTEIVLN